MPEITGYLHPKYAQSLAEFGSPRQLPRSGGWILEREIPGFACRDAMGCYPLFTCSKWSELQADLEDLEGQLVSLALVADPFGHYETQILAQCFQDLFREFKSHCVMDLRKSTALVSDHHRRYAIRALKELTVEAIPEPVKFIDEFVELHNGLVRRHQISGIQAFSRDAFFQQLSVPGVALLRVRREDLTVGAGMYFLQPDEDVVFGHVLGFTELGYRLGAQYALYWAAIEHFGGQVRWCDVGGVPGLSDSGEDGLSWFKRGWSPETRTAYLCGRILDRTKYDEITAAVVKGDTNYFPAYRAPETASSR